MFPPGVKVSQVEQQSGAGTSETPQSFAPPQSSSTSQQVPPPRPSLPSTFPGSLSDLVVSFESVKQKGMTSLSLSLSRLGNLKISCFSALRAHNLDQVHKMLEGSYSSVPQPQDTEK